MNLAYLFLAEGAIAQGGRLFVYGGGVHYIRAERFPSIFPNLALVASVQLEPEEARGAHLFATARKAARNAKIPGQKARILSSVSDRCFYLENRQAVDRYVAEYRAELDELAAHGRHAPSLAAMHARLEDRQKAVTTGADWV